MSSPDHQSEAFRRGDGPFATTHWSIVLAAGHVSQADSKAALARLCQTYWYPLYCYIRRRGHDAHEAEDLTQGYFAALLERDSLRVADPNRGRFRSFLLGSLNHFLANDRRRRIARKRGGGQAPLSLDCRAGEARYGQEPADNLTPEQAYQRRWAMTLLEQALANLRREYLAGGKSALFDHLSGLLGGDKGAAYREIADDVGMTEGAVKVAVHRLRKRCREHLRSEVAQTIADPQDIEEELRALLAVVGS